jgi:hypothetical protein
MAWQTVSYKLTSTTTLLMHNGQMADPLNKWAKLMKQISSKRAKTDADYEELARLEFMAGLYLSPDGPILPSNVIDSMVVTAAKKSKEGQFAKSGVFCLKHARLEYDGPRTANELWADEQFRHVALVRVQTSRVARTRPKFDNWQAIVELNSEPSIVNPTRIDDWMTIAGTQVGLCDWRPQHGRFGAQRVKGA